MDKEEKMATKNISSIRMLLEIATSTIEMWRALCSTPPMNPGPISATLTESLEELLAEEKTPNKKSEKPLVK